MQSIIICLTLTKSSYIKEFSMDKIITEIAIKAEIEKTVAGVPLKSYIDAGSNSIWLIVHVPRPMQCNIGYLLYRVEEYSNRDTHLEQPLS